MSGHEPATTEACARGCSMYRRHLTDCPNPTSEPISTGPSSGYPPCRGCLPRRAQHGHLCWPCHRRFELMLTDAPTVWRWLTGNMTAGEGAARAREDHERRPGGAEGSPTPVKLDVLDLRDLLGDRLAAWADDWAEHHSVSAPRHSIDADAEFLLRWLPGLERLDWIGDWWNELAETMTDAHAIAPWRPTMQRVSGVPCPECEETQLAIFGGESDVSCLSCRTIIRAEHFALWERIIEDEKRATGMNRKAIENDLRNRVGPRGEARVIPGGPRLRFKIICRSCRWRIVDEGMESAVAAWERHLREAHPSRA